MVKFINTTENYVFGDKKFPKSLVPLKNYDMYTFDSINKTNREEKLFTELKLDRIPSDYQQGLTELCAKYDDIFALKDDTQ